MTIDLSLITFENNLFKTDLPDGSVLSLYSLDEAIGTDEGDVIIDDIIIQKTDIEDNVTLISSVVGITTQDITIASAYPELLGQSLTLSNLAKCIIEVSENE